MRSCRTNLKLDEYGIPDVRLRRALTGGLILEIPSQTATEKPDFLAEGLRGVLDPNEVRVSRLSRRAELRVRDFDESVFAEALAIAQKDACTESDVQLGEIRRSPSGLCSV